MADSELPENIIVANRSPISTSFGVDVSKLVVGTAVSLAISILTLPLITRLYDPSAFGILAVFTSITMIITVISCLRYEFSIMLPESNEEAGNLLIGSILVSVLISLSLIPVVWLGNATITRLLNAPELGPYLWLIPPTILLGGVVVGHPALNYWTTRNKHYGWLSLARILGTAFTVGFQIIAGYLGYASGGSLILASIVGGGIVSTLILGYQIWIYDGRFLLKSFNWGKVYEGLKRHYKFPLFDSWAALLNVTSSQLPTLFFMTYFSSTVTGFYALANRLLRLPMNLVGSSISQVFFQRAAEAKENGTLARLVEITFYYLVAFGMFPLLILTIIGKDLFILIFGSRWSEAGVYTQILSVWIFVMFVSSPMSTLFRVLEKQEFSLKINIVIFITRILSLVIGGLLGSPRIALLIFAGSGIIVYGYLSIAIMKNAEVPLSKMLSIILNNALLFLPAGAFLFSMVVIGLNSWLLVGLSALIIGIYYLFLIKRDARILDFITIVLRSRTGENQKNKS